MQGDKEHLNVDLGFLDEAKPRHDQTQAASTYKTNWRNIAIIGGLIIGLLVWIGVDNSLSPPRPTPSTYRSLAPDSDATVNNGQFRCSNYDSNQADSMAPTNELALNHEEDELKRRSDALDELKLQLDANAVNQYSDQAMIDRYNALVSQYNEQLSSLRADYTIHHTRVASYNQQVEARNNYLLTHCRRGQ